jgi:hypothetical protein
MIREKGERESRNREKKGNMSECDLVYCEGQHKNTIQRESPAVHFPEPGTVSMPMSEPCLSTRERPRALGRAKRLGRMTMSSSPSA